MPLRVLLYQCAAQLPYGILPSKCQIRFILKY